MKSISALLIVTILAATAAEAQEAPPPRRMPRTPVSREVLVGAREPMPASHQLQGPAVIIDGERLRIGESDLRLFGIVPPQLSASYGPQARATLDMLAGAQSVNCQIRDRDRDGRLLATCQNAGGSDMALELLKRGLAVTARGSLAGTDLSTPYLAAEQAAQIQKIGLWSAVPAPATPRLLWCRSRRRWKAPPFLLTGAEEGRKSCASYRQIGKQRSAAKRRRYCCAAGAGPA